MELNKHNSYAWDNLVDKGDKWTQAVDKETVEKARHGDWKIILTPNIPVPKKWFPELEGKKVLCLASGGGQQGPIMAAAGGSVTVFDQSMKQLAQDRHVAERDHLMIETIQGSMDDLSAFDDETFDLIIHPVSNVFIDNVLPVWKEAYRVLKPGGTMLSGLTNPLLYLFDEELEEHGTLQVKYPIPYSDLKDLTEEKLTELKEANEPVQFGHTLDDLIGGQIDAGFVIAGFYEDDFGGVKELDKYIKSFIATRALKLPE